MKAQTYRHLQNLQDQFGAKMLGTICQKLLGLAYASLGFDHVVERQVQGVDLDVAHSDGRKYAIEVKTTSNSRIIFSDKDFSALSDRSKDGYKTLMAVLRFNRLGAWLILATDGLHSGSYLIDGLVAHSVRDIESEIRPAFDEALRAHFDQIRSKGPRYLDTLLRP